MCVCVCCENSLPTRLCGGVEIQSGEYKDALKELMDICMLCNDSGLDYNAVCVGVGVLCGGYYVCGWVGVNMTSVVGEFCCL